jgi:branched-chain amino acid transport system ATP-binding protein
LLDIKHLRVAYGITEVLRDVTLQVPSRSIVALLGGNGSGKTTLLNTLMGIVRPASGSVQFEGVECAGLSPDRIVRQGIAQVPQGREVWPNMTVVDNLELGAATRRDWSAIRADVSDILALFPKLVPHRRHLAGALSGGEQQMLAIGRALMARPRCLLMDEPSAGLAPTVVADMVDTILALNRRGLTILLVEQNIGVAAAVAEHAHVLQNGEIAFSGPAAGLVDNPAVLQSYLGR